MTKWVVVIGLFICIVIGAIVLVVVPGPKTANAPTDGVATSTLLTTTRGNSDIIRNLSIKTGARVGSPLTVTGEARGTWFFEASFPMILTDWDGRIIAQVPAQATSDWMTTEYVPFTATLTFTTPVAGDPAVNRGSLILQKDNPSGLPQNDDALEIAVTF